MPMFERNKKSKSRSSGSRDIRSSSSSSSSKDISSHSKYAKKKQKKGKASVRVIKKTLGVVAKSIVSLILVGAITMSIVITVLTVYVMKFVDPASDIDLKSASLGYSTVLVATDSEGNETEIDRLHSLENREWVDLDQIPSHVRDAFVYTEDKRFYQHDGVDWQRSFMAFANLFLHFYSTKQGGSTITQQLIKNITKENDVSIERKVQEIFNAINLEKVYSKDQILESYLNVIPLDNNIAGVQAASKYYFGKDVSQITVPEAATLAAMTRSPRGYSPIYNPDKNKERRNYVYQNMLENGAITQEEFDTYYNSDITIVNDPTFENPDSTTSGYNSWFVDNVIDEVVGDLVEKKGYTEEYAENLLLTGGLKVYTTEDPRIQSILEQKYLEDSTFFNSGMTVDENLQSAMVIMDYNGEIKAMVGRRGQKEGDRLFNLATMAKRQPGSSIKPISAYAPAIERNLITYSTLMEDSPIKIVEEGVERDWPQNYSKRYDGNVTIVDALQRSLNTIPVKLVQQLDPNTSFDFLTEKLGISTLVRSETLENGKGVSDIALSPLSLGGLTYGIELHELTAAYQIFGAQGVYTEPHSYTKVVDASGNVILEADSEVTRAISPETATVMNRLLQQVVEGPRGTGTAAKLSNFTVVGKTGTSDPTKDQYFVGLTPYYVAGVWYGYENGDLLGNYNAKFARITQVWKNVMADVMDGLPAKEFELSDQVIEKNYCTETGMLAKDTCPSQAVGYYKKDYLPDYCTAH